MSAYLCIMLKDICFFFYNKLPMNWYNLFKIAQDVIECNYGKDPQYTDIGHTPYNKDPIPSQGEYYMWVFFNGEILIKKEVTGNDYHEKIFPFMNTNFKLYRGRYDADRKILTIARPIEGPFSEREVPKFLIAKLKRKFPGVQAIYTY